jgi:hypothetical protein
MFDPKPHLIRLPRRVKDRQSGQVTTVYDDYLEVKWRLVWFRERFPHGVIHTEEICVDLERGYARFLARVEDGEGGRATGYGTETAAGFTDYVERAETRALGRALAALGIGTQFVGQDLTEGAHVVDAPVARDQGSGSPVARDDDQAGAPLTAPGSPGGNGHGRLPPEARLTQDQARTLKQLAHVAFGYREGERRLRADLGFEVDESLTLRHIAAHTMAERYATLRADYEAALRRAVETDVAYSDPTK